MILRFISKYWSHALISKLDEVNPTHAANEIITLLYNRGIDYKKTTYIPSQEDKVFFYRIYGENILQSLKARKRDLKSVEALIEDKWPTKAVSCKGQGIKLLIHYDMKLLKWISYYNAFQKAFFENTNIYIDFFDRNDLKGKKEQIEQINHLLIIHKMISISELSKETKIRRCKLFLILMSYKKYGIVSFCKLKYISLTVRGRRVLDSEYKQKY